MSLIIEKTDKTMIFKDLSPVSRDEAKALIVDNFKKANQELLFVPNNDSHLSFALGYTKMAINHMRKRQPDIYKYNMDIWNSFCMEEVQWLNPFIRSWIPTKLQKHIDKISFDYIDHMWNDKRRWNLAPAEYEFKEWLDERKTTYK